MRLLDDVPIETRVGHVLDEFGPAAFEAMRTGLEDAGLHAGLSVPAIHLRESDWLAAQLESFVEAGHELLVHGIRHTTYMETGYVTARQENEAARRALRSTPGADPAGFHVPYGRVSSETVRAAADAFVEWIVGTPTAEPTGPEWPPVVTPVQPYDLHRIERGVDPEEAFEAVASEATDESIVLFHPSVAAHHGALPTFLS